MIEATVTAVNNLEKVYKKLKKLKMKFICKPLLSNDKKVKLTFCRAPEGTLIEMVEELKNRSKDLILTHPKQEEKRN